MSRELVPSREWVALTDATLTTFGAALPRAIYVGVAGDVHVLDSDGTTVIFIGVPAGTFMPIRPTAIAAATTATDVVALF